MIVKTDLEPMDRFTALVLTTGFVLTGQGVHQDVDSARIRHQPGGGQPGEVSSGVPYNIIIILS